ncbi:SAM hydrolase/SAM-dependent halogenase family protein [Sediminibacterium soli]|uniref:SAM hydrolase/SAM-dependent halogenase family protein n=1 Tax=Sediminibacterium soli TaxID=2698829 RepID=UPI0013798ACF|nr:SAM-dependent chlorinase/fluorinase [Sediminibacterium soli]NCI46658.1 SAM-dependent chlorinase/fluorinase [Sediminibacterium soli]
MPILTLTTDIGQRDYLVGAIKGQFLSLLPAWSIADITHYLSQTNFPQAAYTCNNAFRYFPAGSFHLVIVNLFDTAVRYLLVARYNDQYIICPDNGILTMITGAKPAEMAAIAVDRRNTLLEITQLAANASAAITHTGNLYAAGESVNNIVEKYPLRATIGPNWMEGQILFIDNFENVVINITKQEFEEQRNGRRFKIVFKRNEIIDTISDNYTSVSESEKLAWFNSAGYLEIALRNGNMAGLFGLQGFNEHMQQAGAAMDNKWFYQTVRIFFE